jgi:hypothetical protein
MPQGSAELLVRITQRDAFTFLSDPSNAGAWFSAAGFAVPPEGTPRMGMTWTVAQTAETRRPVPTCMSVYEPPERFAWETRLSRRTINWMWQVECLPAPADEEGTSDRRRSPAALLRLTIVLRPGLLQAPITIIFARSMRHTLEQRAGRALERAAEALRDHAASRPDLPQDGASGPGRHTSRKRRGR